MKNFYSLIIIAFIGCIILQAGSCKGPQPCKGIITVYDSAGVKPQSGVKLHLHANVTVGGSTTQGDLTADAITDASGQASFTIKNPCILDIDATIPNCTSNPTGRKYCSGTAVIRFDEGATNSKAVYINQ